eukprot:TRINITY_DN37317_c0_g1_i7.p2 TRINITY_DN37317_c0_g1~~TRINITY_DN37317_c0_g1_i7.p2  ORF type:complete len:124 (+),score=20.61 TRINITY_DN37317_c0_g1_i7:64-435(+)
MSSPMQYLPDLKQLWQRRNLHAQRLLGLLEAYQRWEDAAAGACERLASVRVFGRAATLQLQRSTGGMHSLQNFHKARGTEFLLPPEVAACRFPMDVREHTQRLLGDRWRRADEPCKELPPIRE